jgi:AcrR family transcriptional regulator
MTTTDGRRARGAISRSTVMRLAVDIASVEGLEGLSIGTLASGANLSKSGVVALFGTKEQLQLAALEAAREIFISAVIAPALAIKGGRARLDTLLEGWIQYSENRVFAGGCFFAAAMAEVGSRPGVLRDAVAAHMEAWADTLHRVLTRAVEHGELEPVAEVDQLVFEIRTLLDGANTDSLLTGSSEPYARARTALKRLLP